MYLKSFHLTNYKSFADSGVQSLAPGFNVMLGKNNSGKTALLEALSLFPFGDKPHRESSMRRSQQPPPNSQLVLEIVLSPNDLKDAFSAQPQLHIPIDSRRGWPDRGLSFFNEFLATQRTIRLRYAHSQNWSSLGYPSHGLFAPAPQHSFAVFQRNDDMNSFRSVTINGGDNDNLPGILGAYARQSIYTFQAERFALSTHAFGGRAKLQPNAQNLAEVLNVLQGQSYQFSRFNELVRHIFPNIRCISIRPHPGQSPASQLEILVWNSVAPPDRDDLAQPLSESGTGIGQVLAMLYILVTASSPQTIIIDEPNTFLHPGATRKLLELMKGAPIQHQFIVTTHSAEIVNMAEPATLHMVSWEGERSKIESLNPASLIDLRRALGEVGARLSDLFGADHLVWVEGPTERECFPLIRNYFEIPVPAGTEFLPLVSTGDLEAKRGRAKAIWEIYKQLSTTNSLRPPTLSFGLDRETRTAKEIDDMEREAGAIVHFLPRRTYENYVLHPDAIVTVLNTLPTFQERPLDRAVVATWIADHGGNPAYTEASAAVGTPDWFAKVNAPKLLKELFQDISGAKESFDKLTHSVELTKWLLANDPGISQRTRRLRSEIDASRRRFVGPTRLLRTSRGLYRGSDGGDDLLGIGEMRH